MKMFRSLRFCHFLTNKYCRAGNVAPVRLSTFSPMAYPVHEKVTSLDTEYLCPGNNNIKGIGNIRYTLSGTYWHQFLDADVSNINWDECLARPEVPREKYVNTYAIIFLVCQQKKLHECAISFFNYLWDKREITAGLLNLFCSMMMENPKSFESCHKIIFKIFQNVMNKDRVSAKICSAVLLQSSKYSSLVYDSYKDSMATDKCHGVVVRSLLGAKKIGEALELYAFNESRFSEVEKMFLNYFIRQASLKCLMVPEICKFLSCLANFNDDSTLTEENTKLLMELFKRLEKLDDKYVWMVKTSRLSHTCPHCKGKLILTDVTEKEISFLLKDLEEKVIIQDNIFIKSNQEEWNRFVKFIEKAKYDLVMDGLNVKYNLKSYSKFDALVQKLTDVGVTPLFLGRLHFQRSPEFRLIGNKFPIFLTDNLSDDDVFVLYAALKKGKGCYTLSNDKMTFCYHMLSSAESLDIYKRWQATHQCKLSYWKSLLFPSFVANGIQKCADGEEGEFRYHYVVNQSMYPAASTCVSRIRRDRIDKS